MSNSTLAAPVTKLYKRCSWNRHGECPGSFESWSICSCNCHSISTVEDFIAANPAIAYANSFAVQEAEAIVAAATPPAIVTPNVGRKGTTLREKCFLPCPEHTPLCDIDSESTAKNTWRMQLASSSDCKSCTACSERTLANARAYAQTFADKRSDETKFQGYRGRFFLNA